jgi:riboflavin synthase
MFTGIIEEIGKISKISKGLIYTIHIASELKVKKGDSIAIQGTCLTVMDVDSKGFSVEVMKQTKGVTTLSEWHVGNQVNLERALKIGDRLGGHILSGHVDERAKVIRIRGNEYYFQIDPRNVHYLIPKGPIGIDGVSLTISSISQNTFSVSLIPYTLKSTTLSNLRKGSFVNVEYDYLAKILLSRDTGH